MINYEDKRFSILIVDDIPDNLKLLSQILRVNGYKVRIASNGTLALKTVKKEIPDLILLDILMPDMNGFEVCDYLKKNKDLRNIPVIFLSALDDVEDKLKAFESGGADYITKPYKEVEVLTRIRHQLELKMYRDKLEDIVEERTEELREAIEKQKKEIEIRKDAEQELEKKNIALNEVLNHLENEKLKMKEDFTKGIELLIIPTLKKINMYCNSTDKKLLNILNENIKQLSEPYTESFNNLYSKLSPQEAEICQLIRNRLVNKEIAKIMNISLNTVKWHRNNIRKKLGLKSRKENLASYIINHTSPTP